MAMLDALLDLIFPPHCPVCRARAILCPECLAAMPRYTTASPLVLPRTVGGPDDVYAWGRFDGDLRVTIHALKYRDNQRIAVILGRELADLVRRIGYQADVCIPVPMHHGRRRERGYNQAELLARACARALRIPLSKDLRKRRRTKDQITLSQSERAKNVSGAFVCSRPVAGAVLLIDDVCTTGATLNETSAALRAAGAERVVAVTVARVEIKRVSLPQE